MIMNEKTRTRNFADYHEEPVASQILESKRKLIKLSG